MKVDLITVYSTELDLALEDVKSIIRVPNSFSDASLLADRLGTAALTASKLAGALAIKHQPELERP